MDHLSLGTSLLGVLAFVGALRVVPLILDDVVSLVKRTLDSATELVQACRTWRSEVLPPSCVSIPTESSKLTRTRRDHSAGQGTGLGK
jgi:hypothetical protein